MRITSFSMLLLVLMVGCGRDPGAEDPTDPEVARLVEEMQARYQAGDWGAALTLADSAARKAPELPLIPFTRGQILTDLKNYSEAERAYMRALDLNSSYRRVWYNLGHNAFLRRRYREALSHYMKERALVESGESEAGRFADEPGRGLPAINAQIGRTYDLLGVQDSARMSYLAAIEIDSTYAVAHAWLSDHYEKTGRIGEALRHAEQALKNSPQEVEYTYQVGSLLFQMGRTEEAVPLLAAVVRRWPGHEGATYNLGRALKALGRDEEGQALLDRVEDIQDLQEEALIAQRAVEMDPADPEGWVHLAGLMLRSGYVDKAEQAFTAARARKPNDLSLQNDLANIALVRGDTALAIHRFQTLLQKDSSFADAWLNLGIIYAIKGREAEARQAWQSVLRYRPNDPDAQAYLDQLSDG